MSVDAAQESPRPAKGSGFSDAVTFAFGDADARVYGVARVGLAGGAASGLMVLFSGTEAVAARAEGDVAVGEPAWEAVRAAGVRTTIDEPLRHWTVSCASEDAGFELAFEARGAPVELARDGAVAKAGGMEGYEHVCAVTGTARIAGEAREISGHGQRAHLWGRPDWDRIVLARTLNAWLGDDRAITLTAVRPSKAKGHSDEAISAWLIQDGEPVPVVDPRLSTTYDAGLRQRRAGLELWMTEEEHEFARRVAGEVLCGTTLDLGRLRLDCAFFAFHMEGRTGIGRYDVLRRADGKARDPRDRLRSRRRADLAAVPGVRSLPGARGHPHGGAGERDGRDRQERGMQPALRAGVRAHERARLPGEDGRRPHRGTGSPDPDGRLHRAPVGEALPQRADDRADGAAARRGAPDGAADEQRPRVGGAVARHAARRGHLRAR